MRSPPRPGATKPSRPVGREAVAATKGLGRTTTKREAPVDQKSSRPMNGSGGRGGDQRPRSLHDKTRGTRRPALGCWGSPPPQSWVTGSHPGKEKDDDHDTDRPPFLDDRFWSSGSKIGRPKKEGDFGHGHRLSPFHVLSMPRRPALCCGGPPSAARGDRPRLVTYTHTRADPSCQAILQGSLSIVLVVSVVFAGVRCVRRLARACGFLWFLRGHTRRLACAGIHVCVSFLHFRYLILFFVPWGLQLPRHPGLGFAAPPNPPRGIWGAATPNP